MAPAEWPSPRAPPHGGVRMAAALQGAGQEELVCRAAMWLDGARAVAPAPAEAEAQPEGWWRRAAAAPAKAEAEAEGWAAGDDLGLSPVCEPWVGDTL
jgi:hypothetical protein